MVYFSDLKNISGWKKLQIFLFGRLGLLHQYSTRNLYTILKSGKFGIPIVKKDIQGKAVDKKGSPDNIFPKKFFRYFYLYRQCWFIFYNSVTISNLA